MHDAIDRSVINALQGGFPVSERPFADAACELGLAEADLIARIERLLAGGELSRFGPMFNADRLGGAFCLCANADCDFGFELKVNVISFVAKTFKRRAFQRDVCFIDFCRQ